MQSFFRFLAGLLVVLFLAGATALGVHLLHPGGLPGLLGAQAVPEVYTCPMVQDAEVRSDKPGRCPKCGMDLVPISQTEHKGDPSHGLQEGHAGTEGQAEEQGGDAGEGHDGHVPPAVPKISQPPSPAAGEKGKQTYYCPMHPTYMSDRPGDCPICNMKLVLAQGDSAAAASGIEGLATVRIQPERKQLIGVQLGPVERKEVSRTIRAVGRVEYNEKALSAVSLKFGGWIEELYLKATGDLVKKGEPLFAIYSPDLLEAQRNYLLALGAAKAQGAAAAGLGPSLDQSLLSARERLLLWDIGVEELDEIESTGEPQTRLVVRSKVDGVVTEKNVVQGTFAEPGKDLYRVADLSMVWINADIYEYEVPLVKAGVEAKVHLSSLPEEFLTGKVVFVYPYLDQETRTVRARLEFENRDGRLKPGMYATVSVMVPLGEQIVVDDGAILDSGARQIAFVEIEEGRFEPRQVKVGPRVDGLVVVLDGLKEGEKVVTSGNFLIDSESRLKAALLQGATGALHKH